MIFAIFNSLFTKICTSENGMIHSNDIFVLWKGFLEKETLPHSERRSISWLEERKRNLKTQ